MKNTIVMPHLLVYVLILLSCCSHYTTMAQNCGPPPLGNYTFDFVKFGDQKVIGKDGNSYYIDPCFPTAECKNQPYQAMTCAILGGTTTSIGYVNLVQWSYINYDPTQGVRLYAEGMENDDFGRNVPTCANIAGTYATSTVNFVCINGGDDSITIVQYGADNGGYCDWIFQVNSRYVCSVIHGMTHSSSKRE